MLYINDDHNDDLFRRAADGYPLKTGMPDWNAMAAKLDADRSGQTIVPGTRRSFSKLLFLLLLLVPLEIIELHKIGTTSKPGLASVAGLRPADPLGPVAVTPVSSPKISTVSNPSSGNIALNGIAKPTSGAGLHTQPLNNAVHHQGKLQPVKNKNGSGLRVNSPGLAGAPDTSSQTGPGSPAIAAPAFNGTAKAETRTDPNTSTTPVAKSSGSSVPETDASGKTGYDVTTLQPVTGSATRTAVALQQPDSMAVVPENKKPIIVSKPKRFYAGIVGGADLSSIRLQQVKNAGYTAGIIFGYRLAKKFAVETGLLRDRKYYATRGEYFNPKIPVYTTVEYVNGYCNMWEIPINVLYKFRSTTKVSWSASFGSSTYLMRNESYLMDLNNNGNRYPHQFDYKNRSNTLFSVINVGAVYARPIGKLGELRLEPYLRLPVGRVGTGNMHVQSGGLLVGFTRTIF